MGALARKTVLLVTHQVDFLPAFDSVLVRTFVSPGPLLVYCIVVIFKYSRIIIIKVSLLLNS